MDEVTIVLENINHKGFGLKVNKSASRKGGLIITDVYPNSPAHKANLNIDDHIVKVNNKVSKSERNKLMKEINESKSDHICITILRDLKEPRHQSFMNLSSLSSLMNNSLQTFRNSKSSTDLNYSYPASKKILDSNYVTEDILIDYIQEDSNNSHLGLSLGSRNRAPSLFTLENDRSLMSLDDSRGDSDSPQNTQVPPSPGSPQIKRKQAYKKIPEETELNYPVSLPKYNLKKATNTISISTKDPVFKVKKKTSSFAEGIYPINRNQITNSSSRTKPIVSLNNRMTLQNPTNTTYSFIKRKSSTSNPYLTGNCDNEDGMTFSKFTKSQSNNPAALTAKHESTNFDTGPIITQVEVELKMILFKEKIQKPAWKKYILEQEATGVVFQCLDTTHMYSSLNSTALNPSMVSVQLMMNVWDVNNTPSKFFLPIGHDLYDWQINRQVTFEEIKISHGELKLEFVINLTKLSSKSSSKLYKLLLFEPVIPPIKHKKSITNFDQRKFRAAKENSDNSFWKQLPKENNEKLLLSSLCRTSKVEGVPLVVIVCVTLIEEFGLREEGIYRKSGNLASKKQLEEIIATEPPENWSVHVEWINVHTTSNLLKSILRKYTLFDKDTSIKLSITRLDMEDSKFSDIDKVQAIMDMIYHLNTHFKLHSNPEENKVRLDTFKYIIKHLYRVSLYQEKTKMNAENLATCFMPNLIEEIPPESANLDVIHDNLKKMVTFWINYADTVCELLDDEPDEELSRKVKAFVRQKHINDINNFQIIDLTNKDVAMLVKERIDFYAETAILSNFGSGTNSPSNVLTTNNDISTESFFSRTKNSRPYQSVKQPKKSNVRRRNSSGDPMDRTVQILNQTSNQMAVPKNAVKIGPSSPPPNRKQEPWSSKINKKKKDLPFGENVETQLNCLGISGEKKDVPLVIHTCIQIIEQFGLDIDGVYRISGRNQDIIFLDGLVMSNDIDRWLEEANIKIYSNIHNTACLLKKVLKKFVLIPKETWMHMSSQFSEKLEPEDVKNVLKAAAYHLRIEPVKSNVANNQMKSENEDSKNDIKQCEARLRSGTLRYVLQHLKHVSRHSGRNRMTSNSLAVCFVPVLMEEDFSSDMIVLNTKCIQIVQLLIDHCEWIFQWDGRPSEVLYGQTMSESLDRYLSNHTPTLCHDVHQKENNLTADFHEIESLLKRLIESSFTISDMEPYALRQYFDNSTLSYFPSKTEYL